MKAKNILFCSLAVLLGGCTAASLHPLYTNDELIFEGQLIGKWSSEKDIWEFRQTEGQKYEVTVLTAYKQGRFEGHLVRLEGMIFLDVFPQLSEQLKSKYNEFYMSHFIRTHSFIKVDQIEPTLRLRQMDMNRVGDMLKHDPDLLKHEVIDDRVILTAPTEQLQEFILNHTNTEGVFGLPLELIRRQPLYTERNLLFDEHLIGVWEAEDGQILDSAAAAGKEKAYSIIVTDDGGDEHEFLANLVELEDTSFFAMFLDESSLVTESSHKLHLIPDFFAQVEQIGSALRLRYVPYDDVGQMLRTGPDFLKQSSAGQNLIFEGIRTQP
jgi:hypothetical protein